MTVSTQSTDARMTPVSRLFELQKKHALVLRGEHWKKRLARLSTLKEWIKTNRTRIHKAAFDDFRKAPLEVDAIEIFHVLNEIGAAQSSLRQWTGVRKVDAPITMLGTRSHIRYEPKGVCLIISPWNYPFSLAVGPLVSALAAGNTVIIKPSEFTPNVSSLIKDMVGDLFEEKQVAVVEGGVGSAEELLRLPFDHIFFTGSPAVGKIVMRNAAEHLTSVTLELGGKSPCIVAADANLEDAAERIAVAKFVNNGQTCIAPDYVLADERIAQRLIEMIIVRTKILFARGGEFQSSPDYCRIVNDKHFERLTTLLADAVEKGAQVESEGNHSKDDRFFHPVILSGIPADAKILEEEIFGPVLPVIAVKTFDEAITFVNDRPKPLALYVFSRSTATQEKILQHTTSGGVCINDCGIHFLHHNLPFGGVNTSGHGKSHGYSGFLAFSNEKPVLRQRSGLTSVSLFYPPYTRTSQRIMEWFLKFI